MPRWPRGYIPGLWAVCPQCGGKKAYGAEKCRKCISELHGESVHGRNYSPEYNSWMSMKARCYYPKHGAFHNYGGRGITVCDRWNKSFVAFLEDVGRRPSQGFSIDRIDTNGNYEPGNVRWATSKEQGRNRRGNYLIKHNGETLCIAEWADVTGIPRHVISMRIQKFKWPVSKALTAPVAKRSPRGK